MDWYKDFSAGQDDARLLLPVIIFDGDDTLWETEPLYDRARSAAAAEVAGAGLDPARFEELQREIDVRNVQRMGLSAQRFPTSSLEAYEALADESGVVFSESLAHRVYAESVEVFASPAPLLPHSVEVLRLLRPTHRLVLLTKGEFAVQKKRVSDSGLTDWFDAICIVDAKAPETFASVLDSLSARPGTSWSVGNSLPSDIEPAIDIGMRAIWIDAPVWGHERAPSRLSEESTDVLSIAKDLVAVPSIVLGRPIPSTLR